jgi:hypothetical protein
MPLNVQSASAIAAQIQTTITSLTSKVKNFTAGSIAGALTNAVTAQIMFLQTQAQYLQGVTRAATSSGADLTSFVSDYFLSPPRLVAIAPYGQATFSKFSPASTNLLIPVGAIIQTSVLPPLIPVQYQVIADVTNANYNSTLNGYQILAGQTSVAATVQYIFPSTNLTSGTLGNVQAGALTVIVTPLGGNADSVTNLVAITNGVDQETDAALRVRFKNYISSLAKASSNALSAAVAAVQNGLTFSVNDGVNGTFSTLTAATAVGTVAATPLSMTGITAGAVVDMELGQANYEQVTVISVTGTTFTAAFTKTHAIGATVNVVQSAFFTVVVDDGSGAIPAATLTAVTAAVDATRAAGVGRSVQAPVNVPITITVSTVIQPSFTATTVKAAIQAAIIAYVNANGVGGYSAQTGASSGFLSYVGIANVIGAFQGTASTQGLASFSNLLVNGGTSNVLVGPYQLARATTSTVTVS